MAFRLTDPKRILVAGALGLGAVAALVASSQLTGNRLGEAVAGLREAEAAWLWIAGVCFFATLLFAAFAWRSALRTCGAEIGFLDAAGRFGVGSLVNAVAPGQLGGLVRLALFAQALGGRQHLWAAGGIVGAIAAVRAVALAALLVGAWSLGAVPLWPLAVLAGGLALALGAAVVARRRGGNGRLARLLTIFAVLGRSPGATLRLAGWATLAIGARVLVAAATGEALGVEAPLEAALIVIPVLDLACLVRLTPGNIGVTSAAVAVALKTQGVAVTTALSAGIALHGVELLASLVFGFASLLYLGRAARSRGESAFGALERA